MCRRNQDTPDAKARRFKRVCDILDAYHRDSAKLIPILQEVQAEYRYLPREVLTFVATSLKMTPAEVYGVASFYAHFSLEPKGKHVIRLCDGTACNVKGSGDILDAVRLRLGLKGAQSTTDDMLFTVETVSCLGACGLAPVLMVNDDVHGQMTVKSAVALVDNLLEEEKR